jgi:hypothetical protein
VDEKAPFTVRFWGDDGTPLRLPLEGGIGFFEAVQQTIPAGGTFTIRTPGVNASLLQGWAELETSKKIDGVAVFRQRVSGRPDQEAAVPLTPNLRRFVLPFDNTQGFVTSMALVNANAMQPVTASVVVRDEMGAQILPDSISVAAHSHGAFALPDRYPRLANLRGVAEFSAPTTALSGLGLRFSPGGAFTSFPTLPK